MANPKISVIIPVFNSIRHLKACLDSVRAAKENYGNAELIICDNGSTDGSYEMLLSHYGDAVKVYQETGITVSALRNYGARLAQGDYLSFIDSDCVIPREYFSSALNVLASVGADATGCYYALPASPHWIEETWDNLNRLPVNAYVPCLWAGNFVIKKAAFDKVGGFDESLVTGEDAELGFRLNASGFRIFASPDVSAVHLGNPKTLTDFFRKEVWHGLGMFGTFRHSFLDKPLLATFAHLVLTTAGVINLFAGPGRVACRVAASLALFALVPGVGVIYRMALVRSLYRPFRSLFLYHLYFAARVWALFKILGRRIQ